MAEEILNNQVSSKTYKDSAGRKYPDPFLTFSSSLLPNTMDDVLKWAEAVWVNNGTYAQAMKRVVSYFVTKVEIQQASDDETTKYDSYINRKLQAPNKLQTIGIDTLCYGNSFTSLYVPFKRFLECSNCKAQTSISEVDYKIENKKLKWTCKRCNHRNTTSKPITRKLSDENQLQIIRWAPQNIKIIQNPVSGKKTYFWKVPNEIKREIKKGNKYYIDDMPWEIVESVFEEKDFKFEEGALYHICDEPLAGFKTGGWGLPLMLYNFRQAFYIQMAKMYNEVFMNEYIAPFRVISPPDQRQIANDPARGPLNMGNFNREVLKMLGKHQKNPGGYYSLPFPINYQVLGGEGVEMTTHDHIAAAMDEFLNAIGVPAELYKGSLSFQALPTALRLFQQTWGFLKAHMDNWLDWLMDQLSRIYNWDRAYARLQPVTLADDVERRQLLMQLMAGQYVSPQSVLSPLGYDAKDEIGKIFDFEKYRSEEQQKFDQEMQQKMMMQERFVAPQQPQGMMGPGGQASITPQDMMARAEQEAQRLVAMPYAQRRSELLKIKKSDEQLHASVKQKLEDLRNAAASQGQQMVIQQQYGGPMGQQPPQQ